MAKRRGKKHRLTFTCVRCTKPFHHPNVYGGRCEECFAGHCAHDDSVNKKPRKAVGGNAITVHIVEPHTNPGRPGGKAIGARSW